MSRLLFWKLTKSPVGISRGGGGRPLSHPLSLLAQKLHKTYYGASYMEGQCDDHDKRMGPMESFPMMLADAT